MWITVRLERWCFSKSVIKKQKSTHTHTHTFSFFHTFSVVFISAAWSLLLHALTIQFSQSDVITGIYIVLYTISFVFFITSFCLVLGMGFQFFLICYLTICDVFICLFQNIYISLFDLCLNYLTLCSFVFFLLLHSFCFYALCFYKFTFSPYLISASLHMFRFVAIFFLCSSFILFFLNFFTVFYCAI